MVKQAHLAPCSAKKDECSESALQRWHTSFPSSATLRHFATSRNMVVVDVRKNAIVLRLARECGQEILMRVYWKLS